MNRYLCTFIEYQIRCTYQAVIKTNRKNPSVDDGCPVPIVQNCAMDGLSTNKSCVNNPCLSLEHFMAGFCRAHSPC